MPDPGDDCRYVERPASQCELTALRQARAKKRYATVFGLILALSSLVVVNSGFVAAPTVVWLIVGLMALLPVWELRQYLLLGRDLSNGKIIIAFNKGMKLPAGNILAAFAFGSLIKKGVHQDAFLLNRQRFNYSWILATTPAPTVRPPSRIAKRKPSSIAIGQISSTVILMLSPGITISTPSGSSMLPVTSVVRK